MTTYDHALRMRLVTDSGPCGLDVREGERRRERAHRACVSLPGRQLTAPAHARRFARDVLGAWHIPGEQAQDTAYIVSELAANAVVHTVSTTIRLVLFLAGRQLTVSMLDRGPRRPIRPRPVDEAAESGRGLQLVDELAEDWGAVPCGGGSRVWARLTVPSDVALPGW